MTVPPSIVAFLSVLLLALPVRAGDEPSASAVEARGVQLMAEGEYEQAEETFAQLVEMVPDSFVGHYNLACAHARQGEIEEAAEAMGRAITLGFTDMAQLRRDPDLDALRQDAWFDQLVQRWGELIEARRKEDIARAERLMHEPIERRTDPELRIELRSAHDPTATDEAMQEIAMIAKWSIDTIFTHQRNADLSEHPWVMIALPDRRGFERWAVSVFGPGVRGSSGSVGGAYEHQRRRLVAQDLGATLRHEFVHVLHWRDMNRLGQVHAAWVQEGLASLVEDYDPAGDSLEPVASWRTNIVKRLLDANRLPSIERLSRIQMDAFTARRPLAQYAQARTVMLWLHQTGRLHAFYEHYCAHYDEDPSGYASLLAVFGSEAPEMERAYRRWVSELPSVPETGSDLRATLGIAVENGSGDGVVVRGLSAETRRRTGLRLNAVITHIDDKPTRDLLELIRVIGQYEPGQAVTVRWRVGAEHTSGQMTLLKR